MSRTSSRREDCLISHAGRQAQFGEGQQRERPLERRVAGGGEVEGGRQVLRGHQPVADRGRDLAQEAMGGQGDEGLVRRGGESEGIVRRGAGAGSVAGYLVVARPGDLPVRASEHAFAPGEPPVVRLQPGDGPPAGHPRRGRDRPRGAGGRALPGGSGRQVRSAGPSGRAGVDLLPGALRVAAMAGEDGARGGDLATEAGVAGGGQVAQDPVRFLPAAVEDEAAEPGQAGRDARTESASGPAQCRFRLRREPAPSGGIRRVVGQRDVAPIRRAG